MSKYIIYVGDSFCANYDPRDNTLNGNSDSLEGKGYSHGQSTHINYAADELGLTPKVFGYSGHSWFFSRFNLIKYIERNPTLIENTEAIIFFHTDNCRPNTTNLYLNASLKLPSQRHHRAEHKILVKPYRDWFKYILDEPFQLWAQEQWLLEINSRFRDIKKIHFNNFESTVKSSNLLDGVVFTTTLCSLSIGEANDSLSLIEGNSDTRNNHFNDYNNRAISNLVVNSINNYVPGRYSIDESKFDSPDFRIKFRIKNE